MNTARRMRLAFATGLALSLIACGGKTENEAADNAENVSSNRPATANVTEDAITNMSAGDLLSKYVGKHPSEAIDGKRFLDEPAVKTAVAAIVPDATVRNFVFNYNGPDAPIVNKAGRILAWGCERHNCGYHNWSVSITPDGSSAEVCFYHNDDSADGPATWYLPGWKTEQRPGNCPSD